MQNSSACSLSPGRSGAGTPARYLILTVVLLIGSVLVQLGMRLPDTAGAARWPTEESLFRVDGWRVSALRVDTAPAKFRVVSRTYTDADGTTVDVALWTSPDAKRIYRADATVPFVNAGYTIEQAPTDLVPAAPHRELLVLHDASRRFLELHVYGERRGSFGTGAMAWGIAAFDTLVSNPTDYYLVRLFVPLDENPAQRAHAAASLADTLVPRLAAWYAAS